MRLHTASRRYSCNISIQQIHPIPKEALDVLPFLFTQEGSGTRVIAGGLINSIRGESS